MKQFVGQGSYGSVVLAGRAGKSELVAIKAIKKSRINSVTGAGMIFNEKSALQDLSDESEDGSRYFTKFLESFHDPHNFYFVLVRGFPTAI